MSTQKQVEEKEREKDYYDSLSQENKELYDEAQAATYEMNKWLKSTYEHLIS